MKLLKKCSALALALALSLSLAACADAPASARPTSSAPSQAGGTRLITDGAWRQVEVPETVESVVCVGVGALRYTCYMGAADRVVGVEDYENQPDLTRLYSYVNGERFKDLPVIGTNGSPNAEEIITVDPQVIVMSEYASADADDKVTVIQVAGGLANGQAAWVEATNDGVVPSPMKKEDAYNEDCEDCVRATDVNPELEGANAEAKASAVPAGRKTLAVTDDELVNNYVTPALPDKPIPIRTPSQVMRIWVAPYVDVNGDLQAPGFVYTEIEPRRWIMKTQSGDGSFGNAFAPLEDARNYYQPAGDEPGVNSLETYKENFRAKH